MRAYDAVLVRPDEMRFDMPNTMETRGKVLAKLQTVYGVELSHKVGLINCTLATVLTVRSSSCCAVFRAHAPTDFA